MEIGKETLSDTDLFSVVAVEWLVDDDLVISDVPEQTFEDVETACIISRGECVISVNDLLDSIKFIQQLPSMIIIFFIYRYLALGYINCFSVKPYFKPLLQFLKFTDGNRVRGVDDY